MKPFTEKRRSRQLISLVACLGMILISTGAVNAPRASACRPQIIVSSNLAQGRKLGRGPLCPLASVRRSAATDDGCKDANRLTTPSAALQELANADVVYLGETHDRPEDHKIQLQIVQELQARNRKVAIAMEMFQQPYQDILNRYLAGQLSEQELVQQSEYNQRWGFSWEYYAPILRFAKEKQLPVLALNTPSEITRSVARAGLESLTEQQRQLVPPFSEIRTDNAEYRKLMAENFQQHQHSGHGNSADFERFFQAQVLWDETMAAGIAKFLKANPNYQVVVLVGQGHTIYGYGIPSRVARRVQDQKLVQRSVLLSPPQDNPANAKKPIADFIWQQ